MHYLMKECPQNLKDVSLTSRVVNGKIENTSPCTPIFPYHSHHAPLSVLPTWQL